MRGKFIVVITIGLLVISAGLTSAGDKDKPKTGKAGFTKIFNAKDLSGWEGDPAFWSVENARIVAGVKPRLHLKNRVKACRNNVYEGK